MPDRKFDLYLEDMIDSMNRIGEYIEGKDLPAFKKDRMAVDAVIRNFEIIGEAAKNIPDDLKDKHPEIPWKKMYGLRNLISHEYFGVDYNMIWHIATKNLLGNKNDLVKVLNDIKGSS